MMSYMELFLHILHLHFLFNNDILDDDLYDKLNNIISRHKEFLITLKGLSFHYDERVHKYYIFLDVHDGFDEIMNIHREIYNEVLNDDLPLNYIPHITLGCVDEIRDDIVLDEDFSCTVSNVSVEFIGENEESKILFDVNFCNDKVMM